MIRIVSKIITYSMYCNNLKYGLCLVCGRQTCGCRIIGIMPTVSDEVFVTYEDDNGQ